MPSEAMNEIKTSLAVGLTAITLMLASAARADLAPPGGTSNSGGASNGTGGRSGNASSGSAGAPQADSDDGGCSVGTRGAERGLAGALLAVGLGALLVGRRRRA